MERVEIKKSSQRRDTAVGESIQQGHNVSSGQKEQLAGGVVPALVFESQKTHRTDLTKAPQPFWISLKSLSQHFLSGGAFFSLEWHVCCA